MELVPVYYQIWGLILYFVHGTLGDSHFHERLTYSEGQWETEMEGVLVEPGPCHLEIFDSSRISQDFFLDQLAYKTPFVLRHVTNNAKFRALVNRDHLVKHWGHKTVTLSSANSYSYEKKKVLLEDYLETMMGPASPTKLANETFYFFGDNDVDEWNDLFKEYILPPLNLPRHRSALSFGIAGPGTGVPFHYHGPGFAETLIGRKRWFLTAPSHIPEFHPNKTTLQWFLEDYDRVKKEVQILECTIQPGDIIYFPDKWWHAILNIDTSVFMSTFLSP
ncbi:jmjC domain-containing protein 8 [Lepeophtheirus salmonis]|uniref:jmjC domain-containing protein 8 n=1 Tax=Lepeophtheirus salmonis TaxID=72036 RepID=UPI001AE14F6B|nr:jmjC domain-containing protein 8-like [Lepeophtheirus salmonis]